MILSHFLVYTFVIFVYFGVWNFNQDHPAVVELNKHPIIALFVKYSIPVAFMQAAGYGAAIQNYLGIMQ